MAQNKYDTIIVGGGIAGLTAAAYVALAGHKTLLIEKNNECGGLVSSFSVNGVQFDAGVRALESAGIIFPMLEQLGIEMEWVKSPVSVGVEDEILHIEDISSIDAYREMLVRLFPDDAGDIDEVIKTIRKVMKHMEILYGLDNPAFKDLKNDREYLFKQLLPWLPRFIFTVGKINRMNMPVETYLEGVVKNPSLRDVIAQHFFKHTPTFFAMSYFSLYLDYHYPLGGVGRLAEVLVEKIEELGGHIKLETTITGVEADIRQITDDKGETYEYDQMIWAADLKSLYANVKTDNFSPKIRKKIADTKQKMLERRGSDSIFAIYMTVEEPLETFKQIAHGHFFYTPSKQGLGETHTTELNQLLDNWENVTKEEVYAWLKKFAELNTYEISIPALKDPSLTPPGKTGVALSFLFEYDLFKKIKADGWHDEFRAEVEKQMVRVITESIFPMLKDNISHSFSFTPLSFEGRVGSSEGAIVGWSFQESIPVRNKIQHSAKSVLTAIPHVFQAGQWAYSPAGVPMSILTGKLASDKVVK